MAILTRRQIRELTVARLLATSAITDVVGVRVTSGRTIPFDDDNELPCLVVYTSSEDSQWRGPGCQNPDFARVLEIGVTAFVKAATDAALELQTDIGDAIQLSLLGNANWVANFEQIERHGLDLTMHGNMAEWAVCAVKCRFWVRNDVDYSEV